jgi:threonine synthase
MEFVSTAGESTPTDLRSALIRGLAPDGGLYLPAALEPLSAHSVADLRGCSLQEAAVGLAPRLFGTADPATRLGQNLRDALSFPIPLVPLEERIFVLEVFHGPTLAFKDVGARCMARLMATLHDQTEPLTVLTATSGDTGGAVAHAFHGLPNTRVVVLYPEGRVSAFQERQFTTLGGNVRPVAVSGTFDDCQRLVKRALEHERSRAGRLLTSANSVNIGRLLPQVFYYAYAWAQLPASHAPLLVSVPSGNFGNLTAGLIAKRLGIPIDVFVAATNANDVVPQFLRTGDFNPRPSMRTISSAMDVGNPSNVDRMLALYEHDLTALRRDVVGRSSSDAETRDCIAEVFGRTGYVLDPHSAVGYLGLEAELASRRDAVGLLLATAHPSKFADIVEPLIEHHVPPPPWYTVPARPSGDVIRIGPSLEALIPLL